MTDPSLWISVLALVISAFTFWLTFLRKGTVMMTKPTVIFLGPDGNEKRISKVFLRTLLYSTSKRGIVLENMYVRLRRGETQQNFSVWVYGEKDLARGSGLFVGNEGIAVNHHFLTPADIKGFEFVSADYQIEVFAKIVGQDRVKRLLNLNLAISEAEATKLKEPDYGIYFDWGPDSARYHSHIDKRRPRPETHPFLILETLNNIARDVAKTQRDEGQENS